MIQATLAPWRQRVNNRLLVVAGQVLLEMMIALTEGITGKWRALVDGDGRAVARAAQRAVQPAGTALIRAAWQMQGHAAITADPEQRPCCPECGKRMKLVRTAQLRHFVSRLGTYALVGPYYTCRERHGGCRPGDDTWGLGAETLAWANKQIDTLLNKSPQPLLTELTTIRLRRAEGREEMRRHGHLPPRPRPLRPTGHPGRVPDPPPDHSCVSVASPSHLLRFKTFKGNDKPQTGRCSDAPQLGRGHPDPPAPRPVP